MQYCYLTINSSETKTN